jgi:polysaccharide export outer membrane protein
VASKNRTQASIRRSHGIFMKFSLEHLIRLGPLPFVLSASLLGQGLSSPSAARNLSGSSVEASQVKTAEEDIKKSHDNSYVIGNDDVLAINVWKDPDLSRSIPVRSDGKISLPLVGELQAAGRTPLQLEHEIAQILKDYMTAPEVTVIVEQINSKKFNILGQVLKPGSYSLALATTVMDAIATAGGFRDFAKKENVYVLRELPDGSEAHIRFNYKSFIKGKNPAQNIKLEPHDTVIVP